MHFPELKFAYLNGKILSISPKLNFTPNTLGCDGFSKVLVLFVADEIR